VARYDETRDLALGAAASPKPGVHAGLGVDASAIAANASIFAVVHRVLLNPLPYGDSRIDPVEALRRE